MRSEGWTTPSSTAMAQTIGLKVEPGSKTSLMQRGRPTKPPSGRAASVGASGQAPSRGGAKTSTMLKRPPVETSSTINRPPAA